MSPYQFQWVCALFFWQPQDNTLLPFARKNQKARQCDLILSAHCVQHDKPTMKTRALTKMKKLEIGNCPGCAEDSRFDRRKLEIFLFPLLLPQRRLKHEKDIAQEF